MMSRIGGVAVGHTTVARVRRRTAWSGCHGEEDRGGRWWLCN
jgi:hypothetical protein